MSNPPLDRRFAPAPRLQESEATVEADESKIPAEVARGNRHDVHLERDADQIARAVHTVKPASLPADEYTGQTKKPPAGRLSQGVDVLPDGPSAWEALPSEATLGG